MGQAGFGVQLLLDSNTRVWEKGLVMPRGDSYQLQGQQGGVVITPGAGTVTGPFRWVQVIQDTVLAGIVTTNIADDGDLLSTTIPAGIGIGGNISEIDLTSGLVIAYYA
jgi:hypothetical protein